MRSVENPALRALLTEFRERLTAKFGGRLLELTLFGSYARGTAREDSDVDVAVVLDQVNSHAERTFPMELAGDLTLGHGLVIVPLVLSKHAAKTQAPARICGRRTGEKFLSVVLVGGQRQRMREQTRRVCCLLGERNCQESALSHMVATGDATCTKRCFPP